MRNLNGDVIAACIVPPDREGDAMRNVYVRSKIIDALDGLGLVSENVREARLCDCPSVCLYTLDGKDLGVHQHRPCCWCNNKCTDHRL
jgi:hypothetical protein